MNQGREESGIQTQHKWRCTENKYTVSCRRPDVFMRILLRSETVMAGQICVFRPASPRVCSITSAFARVGLTNEMGAERAGKAQHTRKLEGAETANRHWPSRNCIEGPEPRSFSTGCRARHVINSFKTKVE